MPTSIEVDFITQPSRATRLLPRHELIKPAAVVFEIAFGAQLFPDLATKSRGRLDRGDARFSAGERAVAEAGILFKLRELETLLEGFEGFLQFFFSGGHSVPSSVVMIESGHVKSQIQGRQA